MMRNYILSFKSLDQFGRLMLDGIIAFLLLAMLAGSAQAVAGTSNEHDDSVTGYWTGSMSFLGATQDFSITVSSHDGVYKVTTAVPELGLEIVDVANFSFKDNEVRFDLPAGRGTFVGQMNGDKIRGIAGDPDDEYYYEFKVPVVLTRSTPPKTLPRHRVTFSNGDVDLVGELILPETKGPYPAIIIMKGSSPRNKEHFLYRHFGEDFARRGIAVLIHDPRGIGESTGSNETSSYGDFARDALAGLKMLQSRSDIRGDAIGVWGISQGGWTAPYAASMSKDVAFVILTNGSARTPAVQMDYSTAQGMKYVGFGKAAIVEAIELRHKINDYFLGKIDRKTLQSAMDKSKNKEWFPYAKLPIGDEIPQDPQSTKWFREFTFDPIPVLEKVKAPMLILNGSADRIIDPYASRPLFEQALHKAGNKDVTFHVFPNAWHAMWEVPAPGEPFHWQRFPSNYISMMGDWILEKTSQH